MRITRTFEIFSMELAVALYQALTYDPQTSKRLLEATPLLFENEDLEEASRILAFLSTEYPEHVEFDEGRDGGYRLRMPFGRCVNHFDRMATHGDRETELLLCEECLHRSEEVAVSQYKQDSGIIRAQYVRCPRCLITYHPKAGHDCTAKDVMAGGGKCWLCSQLFDVELGHTCPKDGPPVFICRTCGLEFDPINQRDEPCPKSLSRNPHRA